MKTRIIKDFKLIGIEHFYLTAYGIFTIPLIGAKVVRAEVPLSEMFGYVTSLRTLSSGRATSTMEFSHYAETPSNISESVIADVHGKKA